MKTDAECSRIPDQVGIASPPPIVDAKTRAGDWEVDLIVGKGQVEQRHDRGHSSYSRSEYAGIVFHPVP
ncbi:MAG: hypothetical protein F4058_01955 [Rhodothermaceae bacterium]|nr:hypothetical protein [Rhodothermaceae bacterium]MYF64102.1 hypothetical protein [Rhodothermaceae bacterium]MYI84075.1 hypothetical protein [Rhodothermaceae bacterium]